MKSILALAASVFTFMAVATTTPKGFTEDLDAALAEAKTSGKYVYACFSGSDWCYWCKCLEREVFSDQTFDFVGALKDDYLFVFIDHPNDKNLLSEKARENNPKLIKKFGIHGFPSALIFDGDGKRIEKVGYREGGAKPYAMYLKLLKKYGVEGLKAKTMEVEKAYFAAIKAKLFTQLRKLDESKDLETLKTCKPALEELVKDLENLKIGPEAAEIGEMQRLSRLAQVKRYLDKVNRGLSRGDAKKP